MKKLLILISMIFLSGCVQQTTLEWSDGSCSADSDCTDIEYGCGGGHIICTNDTAKWERAFSTCEIVEEHPSQEGYSCKCVENKCAWLR